MSPMFVGQTKTSTANQQRMVNIAFQIARVLLLALFAVTMIAALHPDVRSEVRGIFVRDYRMIVSAARGNLIGDGSEITVVKVKTEKSLSLEVFQPQADGSSRLLERIELPDAKDGFFNFNGQATNLAVDDIDGDGRPEIIAPSFDQNLVGRLNVYHFNQDTKSFERQIR